MRDETPENEYQRWLDEMVSALIPAKHETAGRLVCVQKVLRTRWGVPVQRSA